MDCVVDDTAKVLIFEQITTGIEDIGYKKPLMAATIRGGAKPKALHTFLNETVQS